DRAGDGEIGLAGAGRADAEGDVVLEDVLQILALAGSAALEVRTPGEQSRPLLGFRRGLLRLDDTELDVVDRDLARGVGVELLQHLRGALDLFGGAAQHEAVAAARD